MSKDAAHTFVKFTVETFQAALKEDFQRLLEAGDTNDVDAAAAACGRLAQVGSMIGAYYKDCCETIASASSDDNILETIQADIRRTRDSLMAAIEGKRKDSLEQVSGGSPKGSPKGSLLN